MDRRTFLTRAAVVPLAGGLAACSGSGSPASSTTSGTAATTTGSTGPGDLRADDAQWPCGEPARAAADPWGGRLHRRVHDRELGLLAGIHPQAVAMVRGERDVAACVQYAARTRIPFTARAGGHSYAGYSTNRGLVCNVDRLDGIAIAAGRPLGHDRRGREGDRPDHCPRCPWPGGADRLVSHRRHRGAFPGRRAGLRGAGVRPDLRQHPAVRIATADGRVVTADAHTNPDLYWACRGGGGGNFGVVTALTLATHPVSDSAYGFIDLPWSQASTACARGSRWRRTPPRTCI